MSEPKRMKRKDSAPHATNEIQFPAINEIKLKGRLDGSTEMRQQALTQQFFFNLHDM